MKKLLVILAVTLLLSACIRPPNYPGMVQIQTNEIAFLVDMTGDNSVSAGVAEIQRKDIPIPGYWVRTGRFDHQGYWRPLTKVIAVSQAPVRLDWDKAEESKNQKIKDSKNEIARVVKPGGKVISFGWNSNGVGEKRGFKKLKILLVSHGGMHNDTICVVEQKIEKNTFLGALNGCNTPLA